MLTSYITTCDHEKTKKIREKFEEDEKVIQRLKDRVDDENSSIEKMDESIKIIKDNIDKMKEVYIRKDIQKRFSLLDAEERKEENIVENFTQTMAPRNYWDWIGDYYCEKYQGGSVTIDSEEYQDGSEECQDVSEVLEKLMMEELDEMDD